MEGDIKSTDKLEDYLNDVFRYEIEFKIDKEEVKFIQLGIENLIEKIVKSILKHASDEIHFLQHDDQQRILSVSGIPLIERETKERILKVGSFYENTKNSFPDEFDFMVILQTFEIDNDYGERLYERPIPFILTGVRTEIARILKQKEITDHLRYTEKQSKGKERVVSFVLTEKLAGPSLKLQFKYRNFKMEETKIYVDLVPAYEIYDRMAEKRTEDICDLPEFRHELLRSGRYHYVEDNITFTETELYFMTKVLSTKHLRVYRLLKFLINGHNDGTSLEEECSNQEVIYVHITSYKIKVTMIYHHFSCCHSDDDTISACVLDLVSALANSYESRPAWPRLVRKFNRPYIGKHVNHSKTVKYRELATGILKTLKKSMLSLQNSEKPYVYENTCIPPFARSLLQEVINCEWPENSDKYVCLG